MHLAKLKGPSGFEKLVVIKRLLDHRQKEQKYIDMFFSEARVSAQLNHPNIVQIYEVDVHEGVHYIAMEYVPGRSLRRVLDATRERGNLLAPAYSAQIIMELCRGLAFAHGARHLSGAPLGLIHRDINPHNVLVNYQGVVKIIDFGIAKSELNSDKTQAGTIKGTVVYMSPEQSNGHRLDKRSDLFSVGICLFESLTGVNPFHKDSLGASLEAIRHANIAPLLAQRRELAPFNDILESALARDPDKRYQDCSEFEEALRKLIDSERLPKPAESLGAYLRDLFADEIADEERLLSQTELAEVAIPGTTASIHSDAPSTSEAYKNEGYDGHFSSSATVRDVVPLAMRKKKPLTRSRVMTGESKTAHQTLSRTTRVIQLPINLKQGALVGLGAISVCVILAALMRPDWFKNEPQEEMIAAKTTPIVTPVVDTPNHLEEPSAVKAPAPTPAAASPSAPSPAPPPSEAPAAETARHNRHVPVNTRKRGHGHEASAGMGTMQLQLEPNVRVQIGGFAVSNVIRLKSPAGTIQIGSGKDTEADPFTVKVRYRTDGRIIYYSIDSTPWATVHGAGGIALGRTPLADQRGDSSSVFDLVNPKTGLRQRITIRFMPVN